MAGRSLGMILLAIFLVLTGLSLLLPVVNGIAGLPIIIALFAIGAGICIALGR